MEESLPREDYIPSDIHKIHSLVLKQEKVTGRRQESANRIYFGKWIHLT
jgi:hypothetical protein